MAFGFSFARPEVREANTASNVSRMVFIIFLLDVGSGYSGGDSC